jgi:hypothetical protein
MRGIYIEWVWSILEKGHGYEKARTRELGIPPPKTPGRRNAITDVQGIKAGFSTVIIGEPADYKGPGVCLHADRRNGDPASGDTEERRFRRPVRSERDPNP